MRKRRLTPLRSLARRLDSRVRFVDGLRTYLRHASRSFFRSRLSVLLSALTFVSIAVVIAVVSIRNLTHAAQFGDAIGGTAGALALLFVAIQVALQRADLRLQRRELRETRGVMEAQAEAYATLAEISRLQFEEETKPKPGIEATAEDGEIYLWIKNKGHGRLLLEDLTLIIRRPSGAEYRRVDLAVDEYGYPRRETQARISGLYPGVEFTYLPTDTLNRVLGKDDDSELIGVSLNLDGDVSQYTRQNLRDTFIVVRYRLNVAAAPRRVLPIPLRNYLPRG